MGCHRMSEMVKYVAAGPNDLFLIESKSIATLTKTVFFGKAASANDSRKKH